MFSLLDLDVLVLFLAGREQSSDSICSNLNTKQVESRLAS
jgi:hypothetical protein